eukprot:TRINITY_DN1785_c0_g1_i1.p1 TRINITY_DN1785_c0_g1~~TRINITY_DN1785_c0_g1_i1.p1  ORF type:complete len:109 (+),score=9.52 TRINITY_DN1785_c0_g1_i1:317-643(+)
MALYRSVPGDLSHIAHGTESRDRRAVGDKVWLAVEVNAFHQQPWLVAAAAAIGHEHMPVVTLLLRTARLRGVPLLGKVSTAVLTVATLSKVSTATSDRCQCSERPSAR